MSTSDSVNGIGVCAGPWSEYNSQAYEAELGQQMFDARLTIRMCISIRMCVQRTIVN